MPATDPALSFPFRPWVRSACRKAMTWGMGLLALLAVGVAWLRGPQGWAWDRAFGVLLAYSLLFFVTLLKIWWTAGKPAAGLDDDALWFQPLHAFRPKRVPYQNLLVCAPKPQTQSLRLLTETNGVAREQFLNLGVVKGRRRFLEQLGHRLTAAGLTPLEDRAFGWARPGWDQPLQFGERRPKDPDATQSNVQQSVASECVHSVPVRHGSPPYAPSRPAKRSERVRALRPRPSRTPQPPPKNLEASRRAAAARPPRWGEARKTAFFRARGLRDRVLLDGPSENGR